MCHETQVKHRTGVLIDRRDRELEGSNKHLRGIEDAERKLKEEEEEMLRRKREKEEEQRAMMGRLKREAEARAVKVSK